MAMAISSTPAQPTCDRGNGQSYGWLGTGSPVTVDLNHPDSPDQRYDTAVWSAARSWELAVPNGSYQVRQITGDVSASLPPFSVSAEGVTIVDTPYTGGGKWVEATSIVTVADGKLTLTPVNNNGNYVHFDFVQVQDVADLTGVPDAPAGLSAFAASRTAVDLRWADSGYDESNEESGYIVQRKTGSGGTWTDLSNKPASDASLSDADQLPAMNHRPRPSTPRLAESRGVSRRRLPFLVEPSC